MICTFHFLIFFPSVTQLLISYQPQATQAKADQPKCANSEREKALWRQAWILELPSVYPVQLQDVSLQIGDLLLGQSIFVTKGGHVELWVWAIRRRTMLDDAIDVVDESLGIVAGKLRVDRIEGRNCPVV